MCVCVCVCEHLTMTITNKRSIRSLQSGRLAHIIGCTSSGFIYIHIYPDAFKSLPLLALSASLISSLFPMLFHPPIMASILRQFQLPTCDFFTSTHGTVSIAIYVKAHLLLFRCESELESEKMSVCCYFKYTLISAS